MSPENWQKVKLILEAALERAPEARPAFLSEACGSDADLRSEVESLLAFEEREADFIEESAFAVTNRSLLKNTRNEFLNRQIGKYKITAELGAGGMGAVYLAERDDGEFRQKAAVKIIKRGINSEAILGRFLNERQILAALEHPNVARLIDGGTLEEGTPYFVMEYVDGLPITEYADQNDLNLTERLDLFRKVCSGVAYAHRNLVVHRDLKPSNILVTKDGEPKLLDFGIAKLLKDNNAGETATQAFVLTPEYASPEQVRGESLSTATDIYSLGVVLYELLTGVRPYRVETQNISQIIRAVCEIAPPKPSTVITKEAKAKIHDSASPAAIQKTKLRLKSLRGDLDNIVLKALRKEPEHRYSTIEQFSEDIRRHLRGLPIAARPATIGYQTTKFVRRNPLAFAVALIAVLFLLGGIVTTSLQAVIARRERAKAERRFNDVRHLANSFMFEINDEIQRSPVKARELLVKSALEYLDGLSTESQTDAGLQSELATAYQKIGDVQSELYAANIGDSAGAVESYAKSLAMREKLFAADEKNIKTGLELATSLTKMGEIYRQNGERRRRS